MDSRFLRALTSLSSGWHPDGDVSEGEGGWWWCLICPTTSQEVAGGNALGHLVLDIFISSSSSPSSRDNHFTHAYYCPSHNITIKMTHPYFAPQLPLPSSPFAHPPLIPPPIPPPPLFERDASLGPLLRLSDQFITEELLFTLDAKVGEA